MKYDRSDTVQSFSKLYISKDELLRGLKIAVCILLRKGRLQRVVIDLSECWQKATKILKQERGRYGILDARGRLCDFIRKCCCEAKTG